MPSGIFIRTEEHKMNISKALSGRKLSAIHCARMGLTKIGNKNMLGKKRSQETKDKIRVGHLGLKQTKEHRRKIAETNKRNGFKGPMFGKKHSVEIREKMSRDRMGCKGSNWKGGIMIFKKSIRNSAKYKEWMKKVYERDLWTCKECGKIGGELNAHHIKSFSLILVENQIKSLEDSYSCSELWEIDNGRTLCVACHKKTDSYKNKK